MLPVTIGLGIVNLDQLHQLGVRRARLTARRRAAIDDAFRIYMLPQGDLQRRRRDRPVPDAEPPGGAARRRRRCAARLGNGMRQINLLLIPSAALLMVLATPIMRLVYQRGQFNAQSTHLVSIALFWFAFSLPFAGVNLLLTRTFFALQRPWIPTALAAINMIVDIIVSVALYKPLGIAGLVIGTAIANSGHDVAPARAAADRLQRPPRGRADDDDHRPDPGRQRGHGGDRARGVGARRHRHRPLDGRAAVVGRVGVRRRRDLLWQGGAGDADPGGAADRVARTDPTAPVAACWPRGAGSCAKLAHLDECSMYSFMEFLPI